MLGSKIGSTNVGVGIRKQRINQLDIEIKIDDIENPFFNIPFLNLGIKLGFEKNSKKYKEAYQQAQHCLNTLELIIKDNKQTLT